MTDKIKKFFAKKKADIKFKQAGPGRKLTDDSSSASKPSHSSARPPPPRKDMSQESRFAAQAALMRLNDQKKDNASFNTSLAAIKAQVKRELEIEKKKQTDTVEVLSNQVEEVSFEASPHLAVTGVFFRCPFISEEILSKNEWKSKIRQFLYEQLAEEQGLTACLIIQSCNIGREKIDTCVETLCKYLENIIAHPDDEKYHKIRMTNKVFCEKVQSMDGSMELLHAAGFREQAVPNKDTGVEEKFLIFDMTNIESNETLMTLVDGLRSAEPITLELDRNIQVLSPSQAASRTDLPPMFFAISPEEIKREQQLRSEVIEKNLMLRTKAMREKDELKELRRYKYTLIRIRFPDGILLQGTFSVYDKFSEVYNFVNDNVEHKGLPFVLISPSGLKLLVDEEAEKSLMDLRLIPAVILKFAWDSSVAEAVDQSNQRDVYLKPEVMLLVTNI